MANREGFYSQNNSDTSISTTESEHLIPLSQQQKKKQEETTQLLSLTAKQLEPKKSVHFLTTATSTTTLPTPEPIKRLRPKLNTLLSVLIKQTSAVIKAEHHSVLLQKAITSHNPPRGLRPHVNPRIPANKDINFLIEWDQVTTEAAISYTKLLLKQWEVVQASSIENISSIELRITTHRATEEEWNFIKEIQEKITRQTKEDLDRKPDRRTWKTNSQQTMNQQQDQQEEASTSSYQQPQPLQQRITRRTGGFTGNQQ